MSEREAVAIETRQLTRRFGTFNPLTYLVDALRYLMVPGDVLVE
jgi:ABC-type polysaccharide/polyol phosphate export permease